MPIPGPSGISKVAPFLIEASIVNGQVADIEVCAASDPALTQAAVNAVKAMNLGAGQQQQLVYVNVKFVPSNVALSIDSQEK